MNERAKTFPANALGAAKVASILLLGIVSGVGLIYSIQPPKVADSLAYELFLFTSDKPLSDFTQEIAALKQSRAGTIMWSGGDMVGNIQFAAASGMLTRFNLAVPDNTTPFTTLTRIHFDLRGEQIRNRVRVSMDVGMDKSHVGHELNLGQDEYRVVELQAGEKDRRKWFYAIMVVDQSKAASGVAVPVPRPAPVGGSGSGSTDY